jgi:hypothetical protein
MREARGERPKNKLKRKMEAINDQKLLMFKPQMAQYRKRFSIVVQN